MDLTLLGYYSLLSSKKKILYNIVRGSNFRQNNLHLIFLPLGACVMVFNLSSLLLLQLLWLLPLLARWTLVPLVPSSLCPCIHVLFLSNSHTMKIDVFSCTNYSVCYTLKIFYLCTRWPLWRLWWQCYHIDSHSFPRPVWNVLQIFLLDLLLVVRWWKNNQ